jgi:putative ABC transport system substrate-binding protein
LFAVEALATDRAMEAWYNSSIGIRRRKFLATLLGGAAVAWPLTANAQPSAKIPRIGLMVTGSLEAPEARVQLDAFRQGLRQLGYTEGRNIAIEYRGADARIERFPNLAAELVRLEVDLIFAANTPAALAARQATTTIPRAIPSRTGSWRPLRSRAETSPA